MRVFLGDFTGVEIFCWGGGARGNFFCVGFPDRLFWVDFVRVFPVRREGRRKKFFFEFILCCFGISWGLFLGIFGLGGDNSRFFLGQRGPKRTHWVGEGKDCFWIDGDMEGVGKLWFKVQRIFFG